MPPPPDTTAEWLRPSPRMWAARRLVLAGAATPLVLAAVIGAAITVSAADVVAIALVSVTAVATVAAAVHARYVSWRYAERVDDLLVQRGLLVRKLTVVPYGRMQFIDVTAGPVDRLFGLATVQLHTAAAATDARIPGLARVEAERLRDQLASLGEARAAGL